MNCGTCNRSVSISDVVRCTNVFCAAKATKPQAAVEVAVEEQQPVVAQPTEPVAAEQSAPEPVAVAEPVVTQEPAQPVATEQPVAQPGEESSAAEPSPEAGSDSDSNSEWTAIADADVSPIIAVATEQNVTVSNTSITPPNQNQSKMFKRR